MASLKSKILPIVKKLDLNPHLGQHLLLDEKILDKITNLLPFKAPVIEIGAGCGQLTQKLLRNQHRVVAVEIDKKFNQFLEPLRKKYPKKLTIIYQDVLKLDLKKIINHQKFWLTGSLPYHIIEPLFKKLIFLSFDGAVFLVGAKYAFRSLEKEKKPTTISKQKLLIQSFFNSEVPEKVPKTSFYPQPRVNSAILKLTPKTNEDYKKNPLSKIFKELFLSAPRNPLIKNSLREIFIRENLAKTKREAREIINQLAIPPNILEKTWEQLANEECQKFYFALWRFFQGL